MLYKTYIEGVGEHFRTLVTPHKNKYVFKDKSGLKNEEE